MKTLLISDDLTVHDKLKTFFKGYNEEIIHYNNALKAIDNINEINPQIMLFNGVDFPRHWKVALKFFREKRDYRSGIFVLLIDAHFSQEEAMKASWLGVNGLIVIDEIEENRHKKLYDLLTRYYHMPDRPTEVPSPGDLMFRNPLSNRLCMGELKYTSQTEARFMPREASQVLNLQNGDIIQGASLKQNDRISTVNFKVYSNKGTLVLGQISPKPIEENRENIILT